MLQCSFFLCLITEERAWESGTLNRNLFVFLFSFSWYCILLILFNGIDIIKRSLSFIPLIISTASGQYESVCLNTRTRRYNKNNNNDDYSESWRSFKRQRTSLRATPSPFRSLLLNVRRRHVVRAVKREWEDKKKNEYGMIKARGNEISRA